MIYKKINIIITPRGYGKSYYEYKILNDYENKIKKSNEKLKIFRLDRIDKNG